MEIVPVLDIARGHVVRAVRGDRSSYKPIETPLARGSEPKSVALGLKSLYPFRKIYIADLDGIEGRGRNVHIVPAISSVFPSAEIWIDAGTNSRGAARSILAAPVTTLVIGSESMENTTVFKEIVVEEPQRIVLSLDFLGDEFMGPDALLDDPSIWPSRIIVMTLARIGGDLGPDIKLIERISMRAGNRKIYAAGGIRNISDLVDVRKAGATGAMVASALHDSRLAAADIKELAGK